MPPLRSTTASTLLCVPIMVEQVDTARAEAIRAAEHGADLVEYRVDQYFRTQDETPELLRLVEESPLPCILTCRPVWEGGFFEGDEEDRLALFRTLGSSDHPPRYLDIELQTLAKSPTARRAIHAAVDHPEPTRDIHSRLILSTHDFHGRPADLTRRLLAMQEEPAACVSKVAFRARSLRDNLELFDTLAERTRPTIALGMGEFGLMSRVLAPKFGGFLTFASLRDESATAPGQPTLDALLNMYRFRSIGPATRVYGIVGWPVGHSLSPRIHNAGFEAVGHDGVYLPLPIAAPDGGGRDSSTSFKATLLELLHHPRLDFTGCSITMPHKENLVRLARECGWELDEVSALSGSGNTLAVKRHPDGTFASATVVNTDAAAVVTCLEGPLAGLADKSVTILGAGGVARAIACGLAAAGARITITNRTPARAEQLVTTLNTAIPGAAHAIQWSDRASSTPDAYINCTVVGMVGGPAPDETPLPAETFAKSPSKTVLLETVYAPVRTRLLSQAQDAGWQTIDGLDMFVEQGVRQFQLWTGRPAPRDSFRSLVRDAFDG